MGRVMFEKPSKAFCFAMDSAKLLSEDNPGIGVYVMRVRGRDNWLVGRADWKLHGTPVAFWLNGVEHKLFPAI